MSRHLVWPGLLLLLLLTACRAPDPPAEGRAFEFALIGDSPYQPESVPKFERLIEELNREPDLEWVIHVGDTLPGASECSDEQLQSRFELFQRFALPFVFTPGDNDWFDCVGEPAAGFYDYERLDAVREIFFARPESTSGGRLMEVGSQGAPFVENARWISNDVLFATVHLVALTREPNDPARATARMDAAIAWIEESFRLAKERGSPGLLIATQASPWFASGHRVLLERMCPECVEPRAGLERLVETLAVESQGFDGAVVLAVGDTHVFRVDKPLYRPDGTLIENFTRVETFGHPDVHWVRVQVDPDDDEVFAFRQELVR